MENLDTRALDIIEKARGAQLGEIRTWGGKEYVKTPKGWRPKPKGYKETEKKNSRDIEEEDKLAKEYERRFSSLENQMLAAVKRKDDKARNQYAKELMALQREYDEKLKVTNTTSTGDKGKKKQGDLPYDAKKVMDALASVHSKYKNPDLVQVDSTPKGNWRIYYDGKDTGLTLTGSILSDRTIEELGWEYHDVD